MSAINIFFNSDEIITFTVTNNNFNVIKTQWQIYLDSDTSIPIANITTPNQRSFSDPLVLNATATLLKYQLSSGTDYLIRVRLFNGISWTNWTQFVDFNATNKSVKLSRVNFPIKSSMVSTVDLSKESGACCLSGGACLMLSPEECFNLGGTYQGNNVSCSDVYCIDITPWQFLSLGFSAGIENQPEDVQNSIYDILAVHWGSHAPSVVPQSSFESWNEYRLKVITRNPNAILAPYYSIITTQNPVDPEDADSDESYMYSGAEFPNGGWSGAYTPAPTAQSNLDEEGFLINYQEDLPGGSYSTTPGGRPWGFYGRWPFYIFKNNNWLMNQVTYLGRPVIDFSNNSAVDYVINEVVNAVGENGRFPYSNAIAFDNGAMWTGIFNNWIGRNFVNLSEWPNYPGGISPLSPFANTPVDSTSNIYLDSVKTALNNVGAKLILNTSSYTEAVGHVDIILSEEDPMNTDMSPSVIKDKITGFKYAINNNTSIVYYCTHHPWAFGSSLDQFDSTIIFILAFSMLVYERNLYSCAFNMASPGIGYFKEFFELPKFLQAALDDYQNPKTYLFYREFQNGIVILNINNSDYILTSEEYELYGFNSYNNISLTIPAKTGIIRLINFSSVDADTDRCHEIYS